MGHSSDNSVITFGICPTAERGVAVAEYTGRHSRMWAWDADTLEILGCQDVKARVRLLDISPDGRYCSYEADAFHHDETYVAICRPPYFHALWIRVAYHLGYREVVFCSEKIVRFYCRALTPYSYAPRGLKDTVTAGAPFEFELMDIPTQREFWKNRLKTRCSGTLADSIVKERVVGPTGRLVHKFIRESDIWTGTDLKGRKISFQDKWILADGVPFLDCRRSPFRAISPPEWAKEW